MRYYACLLVDFARSDTEGVGSIALYASMLEDPLASSRHGGSVGCTHVLVCQGCVHALATQQRLIPYHRDRE